MRACLRCALLVIANCGNTWEAAPVLRKRCGVASSPQGVMQNVSSHGCVRSRTCVGSRVVTQQFVTMRSHMRARHSSHRPGKCKCLCYNSANMYRTMGLPNRPATTTRRSTMAKGQSLQEPFLNALRRDKVPVSIYLVNGIKLQGQIESFDQFVILLKNSVSQMVYKHAISTVLPGRHVHVGPVPGQEGEPHAESQGEGGDH